jgi:hypothetical protein
MYMRCTSFAQQWTAAIEKSQDHLTETTLLSEYQHHEHIFDQNLAAHSPPLQKENFSIQLKPDAPDHLYCKVYPLNNRETGVLQCKITEGLDKRQLEEGPTKSNPQSFLSQRRRGKTYDWSWIIRN